MPGRFHQLSCRGVGSTKVLRHNMALFQSSRVHVYGHQISEILGGGVSVSKEYKHRRLT